MAAVGTSDSSTATAAFNGRKIDRCQDGTLWTQYLGVVSGSETGVFAYSKDGGATWTTSTSSAVGGVRSGSLFIDLDDYAHLVFKASTSDNGRTANYLYYMRGTPNAGRTAWTWSTAQSFGSATQHDHPDVVACRNPGGGWDAFVVAYTLSGGSANYASYARVPITSGGVIGTPVRDGLADVFAGSGMGILGGTYSATVSTYPSIDFNHTGDGKTVAGGTPHLYVGWTAGAYGAGKGTRFRKAVYSGGAWTWNAEQEIDPNYTVASSSGWQVCLFDGVRAVIAGYLAGGPAVQGVDAVRLYDRNAADTATTARTLLAPVPDPDQLLYGSVACDTSGNVYLFGRAGDFRVKRRLWTRSTATLGPVADLGAGTTPYTSARRGTQGSAVDVVWTDGTSSPYTVQHDRLALAPATPYVPAIML